MMALDQGSSLSGSFSMASTTSAHRIDLVDPHMALGMVVRSLLIDLAPGNVHWVPWSIFGMAQAATALALSACVVGHLTARFTTWRAAAILLSESALAGFLDTVIKSPTSVSTLKIRG